MSAFVAEGLYQIAFAALAMQCGCPPKKLNELWDRMKNKPVPHTPQDMVAQMYHEIMSMPPRD